MIEPAGLGDSERARLKAAAFRIRGLTMVVWGQRGHMTGSASMAELLAALDFRVARLDFHDLAGRSGTSRG
jgi:transketolase N-terminal domain/subunit